MFFGRYDRRRTLVIRIAAITLAGDSVITLAQFRPSKLRIERNEKENQGTHLNKKSGLTCNCNKRFLGNFGVIFFG